MVPFSVFPADPRDDPPRGVAQLQQTDIAACYGRGFVARSVSLMTSRFAGPRSLRFAPSHVAMICAYYHPGDPSAGKQEIVGPLWVESTTLCHQKCLIHGRAVHGAQAHPVAHRISDYLADDGRVDIYRLHPLIREYTDFQTASRTLSDILIDGFVRTGIEYDTRGALLSGTKCFQLSSLMPSADESHLFCSEMLAFALQQVGWFTRCNSSRMNPGRLLRILVQTGVYRLLTRFSTFEDLD